MVLVVEFLNMNKTEKIVDKNRILIILVVFALFFVGVFWLIAYSEIDTNFNRVISSLSALLCIFYFMYIGNFARKKRAADIMSGKFNRLWMIILILFPLLSSTLYYFGFILPSIMLMFAIFANPLVLRWTVLFPFLAFFGS